MTTLSGNEPEETNEPRQTDRQLWDDAAEAFDNAPDHGLRDPEVRAAWTEQLLEWLPATPARVLDIGCGTGSLSVLIAGLGHTVTGIDFAPRMIAQAERKAAATALKIKFEVRDAADPQWPGQNNKEFDVIVCRHVLWTLPDTAEVLLRWFRLLAPGGRLILIEGFWHTGAGLRAEHIVEALPREFARISVAVLSSEPALWGGPVSDQRYAVIARV